MGCLSQDTVSECGSCGSGAVLTPCFEKYTQKAERTRRVHVHTTTAFLSASHVSVKNCKLTYHYIFNYHLTASYIPVFVLQVSQIHVTFRINHFVYNQKNFLLHCGVQAETALKFGWTANNSVLQSFKYLLSSPKCSRRGRHETVHTFGEPAFQ